MSKIILFDLNETLLDMSNLDSFFELVFGKSAARFEWFQTLETIMLTSILLEKGKKFSELAIAALQMTAEKHAVELFTEHETNFQEAMQQLSAYSEVREGLQMLRGGGFRLAALTNGSASEAEAQVEFAMLTDYFEKVLSAEDSGELKPARAAYEYAAKELVVETDDVLMVAAHAWDIAGANAAGCEVAFIVRPNKVLSPTDKLPKFYAQNLIEIARQILGEEKSAL